MATGPNQILIKRSDTAGVQPSGLSFGEPAINTADGRLFFSQQTDGTPSGDLWEFRGITNERFVTSVNGSTGDVTVTDLVGGATDIIGISGSSGFSGVTAVAFGSINDGVTFGIALSGQTASVTLDLTGFEPATVFRRKYTYNVLTGILTDTRATSNGVLNYNQDTNIMSIYKFDKDGQDFREQLSSVDGSGVSGRVFLTFGDAAQSRAYEFDAIDADYDNTELTLTIDNISDGLTGGNGKTVSVEIELDNAFSGARSMRLPGNGGTTFDTVVTSFAGFTGAVAAGVTTNQILFHNGLGITGSDVFTFDGTDVVLGGVGHFDGGMDGPMQKKIKADEALAALDPVYITGTVGASDRVTVAKADASDPAKMPAAGIVKTAFSTNQEGYMTIGGSVTQQNTSGFTANSVLYVAAGGGVTSERPSGASHLIQNVARAGRINASTGTVIVSGANRTNDVPNLIHARAGISSDGGITVDGNLNVKNDFEIQNEGGNAVFEVSGNGQNVTIGDVDSAGNGNEIFIRDSHGQITLTATTALTLNSDVVNLPNKLRHNADINTHLAFPANDEMTLTTGGVTLAHLTDTFALQQGLSLDAAGITFPDGTHQTTAGGVSTLNGLTGAVNLSPGFEYVFDSDASAAPAAGKFDTYTLGDDFISIHETTNDGITLDAYFDELVDRGGDLVVMKADGTEVLVVRDIGQFGVASDIRTLQLTDTSFPNAAADPVAVINTEFSDGDVAYLKFDLYPPKTKFKDVATFSIDSSSAIVTGAKTKSLYRVPYDATLTNFDVKVSKTGGFTAAVYIAGSDFGAPTTNAVTGCSLGVSGLTGSSTNFNVATVTAGNFLYFDVFSNNSGSTFAQAFLTFKGR